VVFGAFCAMLAAFGFMNTSRYRWPTLHIYRLIFIPVGVFQSYLSEHQLSSYSESSIAWIFSVYIFISFFLGLQIGVLFDLRGPRELLLAGSIMILAAIFLMGICTSKAIYFILVLSIN
jgi:MFS family permease